MTMRAEIYWVTEISSARLATMPKPRGGDWLEDEIRSLRGMGVDVLVSLLIDEEIIELSLSDEALHCANNNVEFLRFPIPDHSVPPLNEKTAEFIRGLRERLAAGKSMAIHCRAGLGRSSMIAACVMVLAGINPNSVFDLIGAARGFTVPDTQEQRDLVAKFAKYSSVSG
jgi:protein-tyrosine phosphatase